MSQPIGLFAGASRCVVCGTFVREGIVCPTHRGVHGTLGKDERKAAHTYEELALELLAVPRAYQREERPRLVRQIVREFDADLVGTLTVCRDQDGSLWLIDGQHRWLALVELGIERWSCEVLPAMSLERQAKVFSGRNSERIAPHPQDAFRAAYVAREPAAVAIMAILEAHGYQPPFGGHRGSANRFICPDALREVHAWGALPEAVATLREVWPGDDHATKGDILRGLACFLRLYPEVTRPELVARLRRHSALEALVQAGARRAQGRDRRAWVDVAEVLTEWWNHGRREAYRLRWSGVPVDAARQWKAPSERSQSR